MKQTGKKTKQPKGEANSTKNGWYNLYVDGAAKPNPGPAGVGAIIYGPDGETKGHGKKFLGEATNNEAEYEALTFGLWLAQKHGVDKLIVNMDSELVIRQLTGEYKVKKAHLQVLWHKAMKRLDGFDSYELCHIPREQNKDADRLANLAIEQGRKTRGQA